MKTVILLVLATTVAVMVVAQGKLGNGSQRYSKFPSYNAKTPPPMTLPDAYAKAISNIGSATNSFYCIAASCLEMTNAGFTGWNFSFANTNGQRGRVVVYFDGEVSVVARPGEALIGK